MVEESRRRKGGEEEGEGEDVEEEGKDGERARFVAGW
jgi:hypothetical protein